MCNSINVGSEDLDKLVFGLFRYALGRKTYIACEASEIISTHAEHIRESTRDLIVREIEEYIRRGMVGDKCDEECWVALSTRIKSL